MKKFLPFFLLLFGFTKAQTFTLTQAANEPVIGDSSRVYNLDTTVIGNLNASATGNGMTWNYSLLYGSGSSVVSAYISPTAAPSSTDYPGCTIVSKQGTAYSFYKSVSSPSTQLEFMGISSTSLTMNFTNTALFQRYPFAFSNSVSDNFSGSFTFSVSGTASGNGTSTAEGTGTLVLATGTLSNVLKIKSVSMTTLNAGFISGTLRQTVYNFYHSSQKFPVMSFNYQTITVAGSPTTTAIITGNTANFLIGMDEYKLDNSSFSVYPVPAADVLRLDLHTAVQARQIIIRNQLGQVIEESAFKNQVDISKLNSGIYFLEIRCNEGSAVKKFIKQ